MQARLRGPALLQDRPLGPAPLQSYSRGRPRRRRSLKRKETEVTVSPVNLSCLLSCEETLTGLFSTPVIFVLGLAFIGSLSSVGSKRVIVLGHGWRCLVRNRGLLALERMQEGEY